MSQSGDWSGLQILGGWKPQAFDSPSGAVFIISILEVLLSNILIFLESEENNKAKGKKIIPDKYNNIVLFYFFYELNQEYDHRRNFSLFHQKYSVH